LQGVSSVMMMEVEVSPFEAAPVLEEAAILFANMQEDAAVAALRDAIAGGTLPASARQHAWLLLFDLFENLGRKDDFDAAAIDFAVAFETSPPAYVDRSGAKDPTLATGSGQYIAITGALDETCAPQLDQLDKAADKNRVLRIEFGKITSVAGAGCALLLDKLASLRKSRHDLVLSNAEHLIKMLNESVETGRRDPEPLWMLLLEMYQLQNMQTAFEETALNYCITYEVSPPSWVQPAKAAAHTQPQGPTTLEVPQDAFYLKGTIDGAATKTFDELSAYAADKERVVIDMFSVKRIDFMAAGAFLNAVSTMRTQAKQVEMRSPSPLISALLISMGFNNQASFTRRGK
jgi:anti-anti-sigma regulatory factor